MKIVKKVISRFKSKNSYLYFKYFILEDGKEVYSDSFELNVLPLSKKDYKFKKYEYKDNFFL